MLQCDKSEVALVREAPPDTVPAIVMIQLTYLLVRVEQRLAWRLRACIQYMHATKRRLLGRGWAMRLGQRGGESLWHVAAAPSGAAVHLLMTAASAAGPRRAAASASPHGPCPTVHERARVRRQRPAHFLSTCRRGPPSQSACAPGCTCQEALGGGVPLPLRHPAPSAVQVICLWALSAQANPQQVDGGCGCKRDPSRGGHLQVLLYPAQGVRRHCGRRQGAWAAVFADARAQRQHALGQLKSREVL